MAAWFTFDELVLAAQRTGRPYRVLSGARERCRCCSGAHNRDGPHVRPLGPLIGFGRHITAGGLGGRSMEQYCWDILVNDPLVPFKAQMAVEPGNGTLWILGTGRANHILNMSQQAYDALVGGRMALDQFCQNLRGSALVGSTHLLGYEQVAAVAPDAAQSLSTDLHMAELAKMRSGWTGVDVAGHGEVASDRGPGDPNEHMGNTRTRIRSLVAGATPPPPPPPEKPRTEQSMRLVRNNTTGSTFDKGFGAVYLVGPAIWHHVPSIAQMNALQTVWGPYVNMGDGDLANLRDAHWATVNQLRTDMDPQKYPAPEADKVASAAEAAVAPVDDVPPRATEAESDEYQGIDGETPLAP